MIGILKGSIVNTDKDFFAVHGLNGLTDMSVSNCLFCDSVDSNFLLPIKTNTLHRAHISNFNGILITDDLLLAQELIYTTYAKKRFIYLYHLEWPFIDDLRFTHLKSLFLSDHIELIARSKQHAQLIEKLFKAPKYIMSEWNHQTLREIDENE